MNWFFACEDAISRAVVYRLTRDYGAAGTSLTELGMSSGGLGQIKARLANYVQLAKHNKVIVLTDLDSAECPPSLRGAWLADCGIVEDDIPPGFRFCIAVREVEAWILSDPASFSEHFSVPSNVISRAIERDVVDPKAHLLQVLKRSRKPQLRSEILPTPRSRATVGLGYNQRISEFVEGNWDPDAARHNSQSLQRAINRIAGA